jgi:hypothetical protein
LGTVEGRADRIQVAQQAVKKERMLTMKSLAKLLGICSSLFIIASCSQQPGGKLSDDQIEEIVKRSYQYVAMYNVNQKLAFAEEGMTTRGYNKGLRNTDLLDHTAQFIARPNNDVLYQLAMLDLRKDAIVFEIPAIESKYVSMMTSGYDHYVEIPMSTVDGDFREPRTVLFYTERTEDYSGEKVEGIDEIFEMTGDFVSVTLRVMPHANEPERYNRIIEQVNAIKGMSLSEFLGKPALGIDEVEFPPYGKTDADIFENNLLEVMQFVFNHTTFDPDFELDRKVLAVYAPLGVVPGKEYNPENVAKIDGKKFREISIKVRDEEIAKMNNPEMMERLLPILFQPKGSTGLESILLPSVVGPIGQPAKEAMYPPVITEDGIPMNALNNYVIRMTKEELPPANAFWSFTLYDAVNGFFIPNEHKKYSVGENSGMKLNEEGGIEIYIAAEKPAGVPDENWLPIERKDLDLNIILRIYAPDLERMKTWKAPKAEMLE